MTLVLCSGKKTGGQGVFQTASLFTSYAILAKIRRKGEEKPSKNLLSSRDNLRQKLCRL